MKTSANGIAMIKKFESCRLKAYPDSGQIPTIGWGHTGPEVHLGLTWTQEECDATFDKDLIVFENKLSRMVKVELSQNQYDSIVDFIYNCGPGALETSTLLKKLNKSDFEGAAKQFGKWINVDAKPNKVLVKRRAAEKELFLKG